MNNNTNITAPEGYKKTAIGLIPVDWEITDLGDLGDFKSGSGFPINEQGGNDGIPFYKVSDMNLPENEVSMTISNNYISEEQVIKLKMKPIKNEAIIFAKVGAAIFLERKRFAQNFLIDNNMMAFVPKTPSIYLKYYLDYIRLSKYAQTGALPAYNASDLKTIQLPIPPLPEQKKIAEILSTWDDAIANCKTTINSIRDRNKGLALKLLTGKKRLSEFSEKWEETTVEQITKNFSNRNKDLIDARIYSVTNSNGFVYQSDHFSREVAGDDLTNYKIIRKNEFAYNPARINVGSIAFFTDEIGVISSLYVCFKTNERVTNQYFIEWLKIEKTKHDIERYGEGGVRIYLWYDLFKKLKISLPSIEEQNAIAKVLETADQELKSYETKLEALQLQKKGLMQQLLTGKIRVNVK